MKNGKAKDILRTIIRTLVVWGFALVGLLLMAWILPGVRVDTLATAIVAVAAIALLNGLLWPLLSYVIMPFVVLTLGLVSLLMNALFILLASALVDGFQVDNLGWAILLALGLTAITTILSSLLTIDDDNAWYRNVVHRRARRRTKVEETDEPGFVFLEFDGLARPILERAIDKGLMPNLARWLETGSHQLVGWEPDMSSQTSASQAGILLGNNHNIPAFRWYDRAAKEIRTSGDPKFLAGLEKTLSSGNGLLADEWRQPRQPLFRRRARRHDHGQHHPGPLPLPYRRFPGLFPEPVPLFPDAAADPLGHHSGDLAVLEGAARRRPTHLGSQGAGRLLSAGTGL